MRDPIEKELKCIVLAEEIEGIFHEGIGLSHDVLHFIDSTFSNPTIKEFGDIFTDESNLERESLIELIFSPDESMQVQLEDSLIDKVFEESDEKQITDMLWSKSLSTHIIFPDGRGQLEVNIPDEAIVSFVSKLNILWKPAAQIVKTLDQISDQYIKKYDDPSQGQRLGHIKDLLMVRMRNKRIDYSEMRTKILCLFLEKADIEGTSFFNCIDYLLDMTEGLTEDDDIYEALSQRKLQYREYIRKREEFETLLRKGNLETLSFKGISAPFINMDDMQKRIVIIDTITLAVYGKIVYCL